MSEVEKKQVHSDCLWTVFHLTHFAWYQRALVPGDFKPGLRARSEYVVSEDGKNQDIHTPPTCLTCGEVAPPVEQLHPFRTDTGQGNFLEPFRRGFVDWPKPTNEETCWYCNCPGEVVSGGFCQQCLDHLILTSGRD